MVAPTTQAVNKMFDTMGEGFQAMMNAGAQAQRGWLNACTEFARGTWASEPWFGPGDRYVRQFGTLVEKNVEAMTELADTGFHAGVQGFKSACDASMRFGDGDFHKKSRELCEATTEAARVSVDAFAQAGMRAMEQWASFCTSTCGDTAGAKPAPKPTKP